MTKEKIELLQLRNFDDQSHESNNKTNEFNELNDFCFFLPLEYWKNICESERLERLTDYHY